MNAADLLTESARCLPDRGALVCQDRVCSYAELDRGANRVVRLLREAAVKKGDRVAVYLGNRVEWAEVFFAAARLGAVLVPVDFRWQAPELLRVVEHSQPSILFFGSELRSQVESVRTSLPASLRLVQVGAPVVPWAEDYERPSSDATESPHRTEVRPEDIHSICYTSGTTGTPRGAVLTHANVVLGTHEASVRSLGYGCDDVFLNPAPLSHRASWARLIQSVGVGATQVLMDRFRPEQALEIIARYRVTFAGFVPTMVRMIDRALSVGEFDVSSVRTVLLMGESCPPNLRARVLELFPNAEVLITFASTEAGLIAMLRSTDTAAYSNGTGKVLPGVEIRIVDGHGRDLSPGEDGQIEVRTGAPGSSGVMRGYFRDPEGDRAAFRGSWFRTGDCGHLDKDGNLHVTDRSTDTIVSGGVNIYSRDVEICLLEHAAVEEVAVVGRPDTLWGQAVVAFVVRKDGMTVTAEELVDHCRSRLAAFKKPREIRFVSDLPRSSSGKVLKFRLREMLTTEAVEGDPDGTPEGS